MTERNLETTPQTYPTAEERAEIMARCKVSRRALIEYRLTRSPDEGEAREQLGPIVHEYGFPEVRRMLEHMHRTWSRPTKPDANEAAIYADYVVLYGRFGGVRRFLSHAEYTRLNSERARLLAKPMVMEQALDATEQRRLDELNDLLLANADLWDDIVPEDPPHALDLETTASPARKPGRNEPCWCGSGRKYKHCHLAADSRRGEDGGSVDGTDPLSALCS